MKVILVAGGTGGHIFPALSVGLEMRTMAPNVQLHWIGTSRSREVELSKKHLIPITVLDVQSFPRKAVLSMLVGALKYLRAFLAVVAFLRRERPDGIIAFGGYICAPVLCAASVCGVPFFLHEQNSIPGRVNRLFASRAKYLFCGFPLAIVAGVKEKNLLTGVPVRPKNTTYAAFSYPKGFTPGKKTVLICGGSQGASSMNERLVAPVKKILDHGMQVVWQTGTASLAQIRQQMAPYCLAFVFDSIEDLYPFYAASTLVICRAGASTLSEVALFGLPCIMIPLPWATDNHQWQNAQCVVKQGWGFNVAQDDGCATRVGEYIDQLTGDETLYRLMVNNALKHAPGEATRKVCEAMLGHPALRNKK